MRIPNQLYKILIAGGSRLRKTNSLLNLINRKSQIFIKIHMNQNTNF